MPRQRPSWSMPSFLFKFTNFVNGYSQKTTQLIVYLMNIVPKLEKCKCFQSFLPLGGGAFRFKGTGFRQMISRTKLRVTALRVNLLAVGARLLYRVSCPALAIKGKLSEWRSLIGPASCTGARRVHAVVHWALAIWGTEREREAMIAKDWREEEGRDWCCEA